ncbi:MAG TPA: inositol monophosphatase [Candidatus Woesearchaeota archaeon]|nr:inositol monophosphatase [Candidatus Woesearchaeota archaeon]
MEKVIEVMKRAVLKAAKSIEDSKQEMLWRQKESKEYVTNCDIASENAIIEVLKEEYPDSSIYSEEVGTITGKEEMLWVIDPIDGTHNFIHNLPFYAISIGLYRSGKPYAGLIYAPEFEACFSALKGSGAFLNDRRITVSNIEKLSRSMVAYDNQFHKHPFMLPNLAVLQEKCFTVRIFGSAAIDLCNISRGFIDARIFHKTKIFDFAAGVTIVTEAGGKVTNFRGQEININTTDIIASNGKIHEELVKALKI